MNTVRVQVIVKRGNSVHATFKTDSVNLETIYDKHLDEFRPLRPNEVIIKWLDTTTHPRWQWKTADSYRG